MKFGALVSNRELGRGLVIENSGSGWVVIWYEHIRDCLALKTVIYRTTSFPKHWACGGGFGPVIILSLGAA
jgi:hypothetical protein|tara:strand:+ start:126 stop:338 length:213 start_codon:yes stop_codon:yes gene_type:complete